MKSKLALHLLIIMTGLTISVPVFAIFCPNNFSQIDIGNTLQQVVATCGPPDYQNTYIKPVFQSQELIYYVKTNPFNNNTSKLSIVVNNDQVVNITITENTKICRPVFQGDLNSPQPEVVCQPSVDQETKSVGSTLACGAIISVGSSLQQVETACGQPAFINHGQQQAQSQNTFTEIRYNAAPSTKLIFENGILTDRIQN